METAFAHRSWSITTPAGRPWCHVIYLLHGTATYSDDGGAVTELTAPFMLWLPRQAQGEFRLAAGGDGAMASVADDLVGRVIEDNPVAAHLRPLLERPLVTPPDRIAPHLTELTTHFAALVRESREQQPGASAIMALHLGLILLHLWRASETNSPSGRKSSGTTVQRFRQLVELHYRENLRIDDFAHLLGVTRAHLHGACLRSTGRTPLELVHDRLIEDAMARLEQTSLSVEQVGYSLGFLDAGYFNRFFKRQTGKSPGAYRRDAEIAGPPRELPSFAAWP